MGAGTVIARDLEERHLGTRISDGGPRSGRHGRDFRLPAGAVAGAIKAITIFLAAIA
jgi:hypothetical protein